MKALSLMKHGREEEISAYIRRFDSVCTHLVGTMLMSPKWGLIFKVKLKRQFNDEVKCWLLKEKHKESGIGCSWLIKSFWLHSELWNSS